MFSLGTMMPPNARVKSEYGPSSQNTWSGHGQKLATAHSCARARQLTDGLRHHGRCSKSTMPAHWESSRGLSGPSAVGSRAVDSDGDGSSSSSDLAGLTNLPPAEVCVGLAITTIYV